jgi:uncharacterized membrane protein YccC
MPDVAGRVIRLLRGWRPTPQQWRQAGQTAFAAVASYLIAVLFGLPQGYWAVMSAILVVQSSIGGSLGQALDRLIATVLGAAIGVALLYLLGRDTMGRTAGLLIAVLPLAFLGMRRQGLRLAPVTAAIILLSDQSHGDPLISGLIRLGEITLGSIVALATALLLWPARAGQSLAEHVAATLTLVRRHLDITIRGALGPARDEAAMVAVNAGMRAALVKGDTLAVEARREIAGRLAGHDDPAALLRTLRRLWHTSLMAARAVQVPLPSPLVEPLRPALEGLLGAVDSALETLVAAFAKTGAPPDLAAVKAALAAFDGAMGDLRRSGVTRAMSGEDVGRLFALSFALGQLPQNLQDLADRCQDLRRR